MSLCRNRNEEDSFNNVGNLPKKYIDYIKSDPMESSQGSIRRTKKNKTIMPTDFAFKDDDEEEDLKKPPKKESNRLDFEDFSEEKKNQKKENDLPTYFKKYN